jgi:MFS family permease
MSGLESLARAVITAALPIQTQALFGNDESVSALFLVGSVAALSIALLIPRLSLLLGRIRLGIAGIALLGASVLLFMLQMIPAQVLGFALRAIGSALFIAVMSMFIMDHVRRHLLGRSEPLRLLYIGVAWSLGPLAGVVLEETWGHWAPFAASSAAVFALLCYFAALRLSNAPAIGTETQAATVTSLAHLRRFFRQPRLVLAWLHAIGRGFFWGTFTIYTPLYAVETGLGARVGGALVGIGSAFLLAMPLWGWCARRFGIRRVSLVSFPIACASTLMVAVLTPWPWVATVFLMLATLAMSAIDGYGNALFLRACKPSERTTMTPIFSAQRDIGDIGHAAVYAVLLSFFSLQIVFITAALVLAGLTWLAMSINRRL